MSEPESSQLKKRIAELSKLFEGIDRVANSQGVETVQGTVEPDPLVPHDEEEDLGRAYPAALSSVQEARDAAEIEKLGEVTRQTRRVNVARLIILGSLFFLIVLWIVSVILITVAQGFQWRRFMLGDAVMITYITTTTASVFGLFHIAAKWLFSKDS
ncbi:MAG TPA: hypothetical protein DC054_08355 [Blastocatellia bacterium]|nr:hypothetical protein [Blastocatellia bacterium]